MTRLVGHVLGGQQRQRLLGGIVSHIWSDSHIAEVMVASTNELPSGRGTACRVALTMPQCARAASIPTLVVSPSSATS